MDDETCAMPSTTWTEASTRKPDAYQTGERAAARLPDDAGLRKVGRGGPEAWGLSGPARMRLPASDAT